MNKSTLQRGNSQTVASQSLLIRKVFKLQHACLAKIATLPKIKIAAQYHKKDKKTRISLKQLIRFLEDKKPLNLFLIDFSRIHMQLVLKLNKIRLHLNKTFTKR